jgi:hypothetical protein
LRAAAKKEKMMWETLREAIDEEMEADPAVLVMGEPSNSHTGRDNWIDNSLLSVQWRMCRRS